MTKAATWANQANLTGPLLDIVGKYRGTRLGRQELEAELLADTEGAFWTRDAIERNRLVESIRLVKIARDSAVRSQTQAMVTLKSVLVTAPDELRKDLETLSDFKLMAACADLVGSCDADAASAVRHVLSVLARRGLQLRDEVKAHTRALRELTKEVAPGLVAAFDIGPDIAAELLVTAGSNSDRICSEAALAKLCGACPIPASSGTVKRHRLNRGGNRQANATLYRAVVVRLRWHAPTIVYKQRRTSEGLSKPEIIRCLKRFLVREIYQLLPQGMPSSMPGRLVA